MDIEALLGDEAPSLLKHVATAFPKELLIEPGPKFLDDVFSWTDRSPQVLQNLEKLYGHGRLANTGYPVSYTHLTHGVVGVLDTRH